MHICFERVNKYWALIYLLPFFLKDPIGFRGLLISGKEPLPFLLPCLQSDPQCGHRRQAFPTGVSQVGHFFFRVVFYTINKTKPILKVGNYVAIGVDYIQK